MLSLGHPHEDLKVLIRFALCLAQLCAVPSKIWSLLLEEATARYAALGGRRLQAISFRKCGDKRVVYYEVDYDKSAAYSLVLASNKKRYTALRHVSGKEVKLTPPLDLTWSLADNHDDEEAKLVTTSDVTEKKCKAIFQKSNIGHVIPVKLDDKRVGMPRSSSSTDTLESASGGGGGLLAIADRSGQAAESSQTTPSRPARATSSSVQAGPSAQDPRSGRGGVAMSTGPPLRRVTRKSS